MRSAFRIAIVIVCGWMFASRVAIAEPPLVVGTIPAPPFIIKNADGSWAGISIDLWKEVARQLGLAYEIHEMTLTDFRDPAKMAALDAFVSLNVSADREKTFDLTQAFYSTGLAIAVAPKADSGIFDTLKQIMTAKFAKLIAALFAMLFVVGVVMWLAERRRNEAQFGGTAAHGIGAGLWWSAVTMTTVGYGDKAPVTFVGRILGLVWMFAAIIIIASFTAAISAALTVTSLSSAVTGPSDLPKVHVGTVDGGNGREYLAARHIAFKTYRDEAAAIDGLAAGEVDAIVHEAPLLQFAIHQHADAKVSMLEGTFDNHGYAFALKLGTPLRKSIDVAMLSYVATDEWPALLAKYLGN